MRGALMTKIRAAYYLLLTFLFLIALTCSSNAGSGVDSVPTKKGNRTVTPVSKITDALMSIDAELFFGPKKHLTLEVRAVIRGMNFDGVAIRAPHTINIENIHIAPLLIVLSHDAKRRNDVPLGDSAFVVCKDITTDAIWKVPLFSIPKGKIPMSVDRVPVPAIKPSLSTRTTVIKIFDLRDNANLPWKSGKFSVKVVIKDWESNEVNIELVSEK